MIIKKGRVLARCIDCGGEAVSSGDGSAVVIGHSADCPDLLNREPEDDTRWEDPRDTFGGSTEEEEN